MLAEGTSGNAILVVDDEPQVLAALKDLLEDDYTVFVETSATSALEFLRRGTSISVIISDQRMPEMSGDEFLSEARKVSAATRIIITGYADLKAVIRAVNDGQIFGYISKPWDANQLTVTVHKAVEYFEIARELAQERALLHNLMDSLPDAVFFKDSAHRYLKINRAMATMIGIASPEEAIGKTAAAFLASDRAQALERDERDILRTGRPIVDQIIRFKSGDGPEGWLSETVAPISNDQREVVGFVGVARDISERERARQALSESERRYRSLYNNTPVMMHSVDHAGRLLAVSDYWCESLGYTRDEVIGRPSSEFMHESSRKRMTEVVLPEFLRAGRVKDVECQLVAKDGRVLDALLSAVVERDASGEPVRRLAVIVDVTEKKALEGQLLQAQKMEAVGQLTGGMAHDFNNLLTVIIGNLDTVVGISAGEGRQLIESALKAAERGAALTHRLLAFSRRQTLSPETLDLDRLASDMGDLLRRTLGEHVEIEITPQTGLWRAAADRGQVENALLNLAINARDAMPSGGTLTINTANVHLDDEFAANAEVTPGDYVMLAVSDSGVGMAPETVERAIEPFFTTKEVGRGTGLGLSMIYGFAKQSRGHLKIESKVDHGTTVRLYLPRADVEVAPAVSTGPAVMDRPGGGETILVVEDNPAVRLLIVRQLQGLGYRTIEAADGKQASRLLDGDASIALLFTDIMMPGGLNGRQLAADARRKRPDLKVLFMSGYAQDGSTPKGSLAPADHFLPKPFRVRELALKVRAALDSSV